MKRAYVRWLLYGIYVAIGVFFYYRSSHKARLLGQLRWRMVTLDSSVFEGPKDSDQTDLSLHFKLREYPGVNFSVSQLRYELLDKAFVTELSIRDTIEVFIKDDINPGRPRPLEKEVYGIYQRETTYLDLDQVLKAEKRSKLPGNIMLLIIMLALVIQDYRQGRREEAKEWADAVQRKRSN